MGGGKKKIKSIAHIHGMQKTCTSKAGKKAPVNLFFFLTPNNEKLDSSDVHLPPSFLGLRNAKFM